MRPPPFSLIGPFGLCSCCELFFAPRRRFGGAGGPKFAERSRPPGPDGKPPPGTRGVKPPPPKPPPPPGRGPLNPPGRGPPKPAPGGRDEGGRSSRARA